MSKPNVLVLGGVGFVGRNVVKYLVDNQLADKIRIADKVLPATAFLSAEHQAAFNAPNVEYKQSNLTNAGSIAKAFELEGGAKFNIVFNLAAETKFGQTKEVYKEKIVDLSVKCATEAAKQGVDKFIEMSTAQVYKPGKKPLTEKSEVDPMNLLAEHKFAAEQELRKIPGLNLIIVRPAIVYGPGDTQGLSPRLIIGAVYKYLEEKMKLLWDEDTRLNTVHVRDVCKALWHLSQRGQLGAVYNLADKSDTDQGKMNKLIEVIYGIKTGFQGTVVNLAAKAAFETVSEQVNDKHLKPWAEMCKKSNIQTPLTPYLDSEMLTEKSLNVDGSAIEATGFTYDHPQITEQLLRESIDYWARQNLFPTA